MNKKFVISFLILFLFVQFYSLTEYAFGVTDQVVVTLDVDSGITISDGAAVTMAPHISITANGSIGSSTWTVITNGASGYSLSVHDSTDPALKSATDSFANYTEATPGTPEVWSVPAASKEFGYSAYGTDTSTATWGTGTSCGSAGAPTGTQKYVGFAATPTDKIIATRATVTPTTGITTTICFAAEQDTVFAAAGTYTATITGTAVTL
ncbi:MAG: hypothetical protein WC609_03070 [Candidatus Paceibacterota bacterium]